MSKQKNLSNGGKEDNSQAARGKVLLLRFYKGKRQLAWKAKNRKLPTEKRIGKNPAAAMECAPSRGDVPAFIEAMFRFCAAKTYGKETEK